MRTRTPLDVCAQIARGHAAGTLAAIDKPPAAKLAERLEHYGETLSEVAAELAGDRVPDSDEDASEEEGD
jgi:hypothetical protein